MIINPKFKELTVFEIAGLGDLLIIIWRSLAFPERAKILNKFWNSGI